LISVHTIWLLVHICPMNVFAFCGKEDEEAMEFRFDKNC
jgi:hypothetical protein